MSVVTPTRPEPSPTAVVEAPSRGRLVRAVAAVEGQRILRHPIWWLGVLAAGFLVLSEFWPSLGTRPWRLARLIDHAIPMVLATLVVAHAAAGRPAHDDVAPQHEVTPTDPIGRRLGLALAQFVPAAVATAWTVVCAGLVARAEPGPWNLVDLAHVPLWVVLGGLVGIALARLAPWLVAGVLGAVGFAVVSIDLLNSQSIRMRLAPARDWIEAGTWPDLLPRSSGVHLGWLAGLVLLVFVLVVIARSTWRWAAGLGAVAVVVLALAGNHLLSVWTTERIDRFTTVHDDPAASSDCRDVAPWIRWCSPGPAYDHVIDPIVADLQAAVGLLPAGTDLHGVTIQRGGYSWVVRGTIPGETQAPVLADARRAGAVLFRPGQTTTRIARSSLVMGWFGIALESPSGEATSSQTATSPARSAEASSGGQSCHLAGQARGAVLLAVTNLATGTSPDVPSDLDIDVTDVSGGGVSTRMSGDAWLFAEVGAGYVEFSYAQQQVAEQLTAAGPDAITRLHDDWGHWMDPDTTLDDLVAATGLPDPTTLEELMTAAMDEAGIAEDDPVRDNFGMPSVSPCP